MVRDEEGLESKTGGVEQVGSNGEKQIARMLKHYGVRYLYEHPVAVRDRGKVRVWYPDMWLPDYAIAIEYAGRTDDERYMEGIRHKKDVYDAAGIACIFVDSGFFSRNWPAAIFNQIRRVLDDRVVKFERMMERRRNL